MLSQEHKSDNGTGQRRVCQIGWRRFFGHTPLGGPAITWLRALCFVTFNGQLGPLMEIGMLTSRMIKGEKRIGPYATTHEAKFKWPIVEDIRQNCNGKSMPN